MLFKRKKKPQKPSYEELGKMLENIYESGYIDHAKAYKMSFLKGVVGGFGGVIGATIVVGILVWSLSLFQNVPFINNITNNIRNSVERQDG